MKNSLYTTICSGKYRGKKLLLPSLNSTRSTKSIVKESFFNTIQFEIVNSIFIEVFAGSGSVGLEALSRGAKKVYFIEKDTDAYKILLQNIKSIEDEKCVAVLADSFTEFPKLLKKINKKAYFYFDPPFSIRDGMDEIYLKTYNLIENIPVEICELVSIEHISDITPPQNIADYKKIKSKKFGKTTISYYEYT